MDHEVLEKFFVTYLKENGLEYSFKNRVYSIKFDKTHKKWFDKDRFSCTFDPKVAKERSIPLVGIGTFLFDSMVARYVDKVMISHLRLPSHEDDIMQVNERLGDLRKESALKMIEPLSGSGAFILFELLLQTAQRKQRMNVPVIVTKEMVMPAKGFEANSFELIAQDIRIIDEIDRGLAALPGILGDTLEKALSEHEKTTLEQTDVQSQHNEGQYAELQKKERESQYKIEEMRQKMISASTFAAKNAANMKMRELQRKHEELLAKNKEKRLKIQETFQTEIKDIERRDVHISAKVLCYAQVEFPYFNVAFLDGEEFYYLPCLKTFFKKAPSSK